MNLFADAQSPDWIPPLLQLGICGAVLYWFMIRCEPRLRAIEEEIAKNERLKAVEEAIDRNNRAILLLILTNANPTAKLQADSIIREVDEAEKQRRQ